MEYLLFLFIVIIVITTGYVLSKPFSRHQDEIEEMQSIDHEGQYRNLLEEIKGIEKDCESGIIPIDDCIIQIREKKKMAADLLRVIDPTMKIETISYQSISEVENINHKPTPISTTQGSHYCPQCGDQVMTSDKFCMHCGHRLQP